jgi:uncharacterized DUF497 family protein
MSIKMAINYNVEWDARKAHDNRDKHDVSLDEAATVSRDPNALSMLDPDHSETEDRWITMGISEKGRLLIVIHAFRQESGRCRYDQDDFKPERTKTRSQNIW